MSLITLLKTECRIVDDNIVEFDEIWKKAHTTFDEELMRSRPFNVVDSNTISAGDYILDVVGCISYVVMRSKSDNTVYLRKKLIRG